MVDYKVCKCNTTSNTTTTTPKTTTATAMQCNVEKGNCAIPMLIAMEENVDHVVGIGNVANVTQPI